MSILKMSRAISSLFRITRLCHNSHTCGIIVAIAVPLAILTASVSLSFTVATFLIFGALLAYIRHNLLNSKIRERDREKSHFFIIWLGSSVLSLMIIFHMFVITQLDILPEENLFLLILTTCSVACLYTTKQKAYQTAQISRDSYTDDVESISDNQNLLHSSSHSFCSFCQANVPYKGSHCVWLDCCIGSDNLNFFNCGIFLGMIAFFYGSNLTLTTVCHPFVFFKTILLPDDCSDVYYDYSIAMCFVSGIYSLTIAFLILLFFTKEIFICLKNIFSN